MLEFVAASREQEKQPETEWNEAEQSGQGSLKIQKRALKREEAQLGAERQRVREKRKLEDAAWRETRAARKVAQQNDQALSKAKRRQQRLARRARDAAWHSIREQRHVSPRSTPM